MTGPEAQLAVVRRALDAAEAGDLDGYLACLAEEYVIELPYANADGGLRYDKAVMGKLMSFVIETFATRSFTIDRVFSTGDSAALAIEYRSEMRSRVGDVEYLNSYVGVFEFEDGLITRWREYANPLVFDEAMAAIKAATA